MKQKIIDAYMFRHACKEFDANQKITDEDFNFILETARLSPSSFGFEPWKFIVVQNKALREKLAEVIWGGGKQIPTSSHLVLTLVRKSYFMHYDSEYIDDFMHRVQKFPDDVIALRKKFYQQFQDSDYQLSGNERAMTDWATHQTYIPMANMMTAAAMIGIDSCPIEGFNRQKVDELLTQEINMNPNEFSLAYALAFGYRKNTAQTKTRHTLEEVVEYYL